MKVWNVTDGPSCKAGPHTRMILGRKVAPGKFVQVDAKALAGAAKLQQEAADGLVYIGDKLPHSYLVATGKAKVRFPRGGKRTHRHEKPAPAKPKGKAPEKVVAKVAETVKASDKVEVKESKGKDKSSGK